MQPQEAVVATSNEEKNTLEDASSLQPVKNGHVEETEQHETNGVENGNGDADTSKDDIYEELFGDVQQTGPGKKKKRNKPCPKSRKLKAVNGIEGEHATIEEEGSKLREIEEVLADFEDDDSEINGIEDVLPESENDNVDEPMVNENSEETDETIQQEQVVEPVHYHVEYPESDKSETDQMNIPVDPPVEIVSSDDAIAATVSDESYTTASLDSPVVLRRSTRFAGEETKRPETVATTSTSTPFVRYISKSRADDLSSATILQVLMSDKSCFRKRKAESDEEPDPMVLKKAKQLSSSGFFSRLVSPVVNRFRGVSYRCAPVEKVEIVEATDVSDTDGEGAEEVVVKEEFPAVVTTMDPANQKWCVLM